MKIGKTIGVGTALVQQAVIEQARPFDVDVPQENRDGRRWALEQLRAKRKARSHRR